MTPLPHACILMLLAPWLLAEDWPQFRGPDRNGVWHETGLLDAFPESGLSVRWRRPVGVSWSSPVVSQGRVFIADAELKKPEAKERLHCLDEVTGKPRWTFAYSANYPDWAFTPEHANGPAATPVLEGNRIWMLGINGDVHCLDAASGTVVWHRPLQREFTVPEMSCRASPLIEGDRLIVFTGAKPAATVMALDKSDGRVLWKALTETVLNSSPIAVTVAGRRQLIVWTGETVTALAPADGTTLWAQRLITNSNYGTATPVLHQNRLLVSGLMLEFREGQAAPVILWPADTMAVSKRVLSNTSSPLFRDDHVYSALSTGHLVCLEAGTGRERWRTDKVTKIGNGASIHITSAGDKAFLFTDEGNLILARLTPDGFQEISRAHAIRPTTPFSGLKAWTPPAYANGHAFVRNDREVISLSLCTE